MFYNAYITPIIDYGCIIWQHAPKSELKRLSKIQHRIARTILHKSRSDDAQELMRTLNWLPISKRIDYFTGLMIFKSLNNLTPSYISNLINIASNPIYNLRSSSNMDIAHFNPRTNYFKQTFRYTAMQLWNSLPLYIRQIHSISSFKLQFKHLLNSS